MAITNSFILMLLILCLFLVSIIRLIKNDLQTYLNIEIDIELAETVGKGMTNGKAERGSEDELANLPTSSVPQRTKLYFRALSALAYRLP